MADIQAPEYWQPPDWHADYGNPAEELEELHSLAIALSVASPNVTITLENPEPGLIELRVEFPDGVTAEIHSIPSTQDKGRRRFAIFVSPDSQDEIEQYSE